MVMKKKEFDEYFVKYRESLFEELQTLTDYTLIYKQIILFIEAPKTTSQSFWLRTAEAYLNSIIIWFYKLVDPNGRKGIFPFLRFVRSHQHFLTKKEYYKRNDLSEIEIQNCKVKNLTIKEIEEDIKQVENLKIISSIQTQRDKYYAHFDSKYFFDKERIKTEAPLSIKDMDDAIKVLISVLNRYSDQFDSVQKQIKFEKNYDLEKWFN